MMVYCKIFLIFVSTITTQIYFLYEEGYSKYICTYFLLFCILILDLKESNVSLKLTIVETVGYGDQINKEDRYIPTHFFSIKLLSILRLRSQKSKDF